MRSVVVTGVSTGIGLSTCTELVARGFHVFGSVRKAADALPLQKSLGDAFEPLVFDITDAAAVTEAAALVRRRLQGQRLAGLVNNAGIAVSGPAACLSAEQLRWQFEVNIIGTLGVTQAFLPQLGTDPTLHGPMGRIVNVSSVAAKLALPFLGAYAASKHALEGLSDSLRRELIRDGIDVIIVAPGASATGIWGKTGISASTYAGTPYEADMKNLPKMLARLDANSLPVEGVSSVICEALTAARPKARYAPVRNPLIHWWLPILLPKRTLDKIMVRRYFSFK